VGPAFLSAFICLFRGGGAPPRAPQPTKDEVVSAYRRDQILTSASYLESLRAAFIARGADAVTAAQRAYAAAAGMVTRQATTLSSIDLFWILAMFFLAMIPLLFFMKRPDHVEVAIAGDEP